MAPPDWLVRSLTGQQGGGDFFLQSCPYLPPSNWACRGREWPKGSNLMPKTKFLDIFDVVFFGGGGVVRCPCEPDDCYPKDGRVASFSSKKQHEYEPQRQLSHPAENRTHGLSHEEFTSFVSGSWMPSDFTNDKGTLTQLLLKWRLCACTMVACTILLRLVSSDASHPEVHVAFHSFGAFGGHWRCPHIFLTKAPSICAPSPCILISYW